MQERVDYSEALTLTEESITAFLQEQEGQTPETLRRWGSSLRVLRQSLPKGAELTKERLLTWRRSLLEQGYTAVTITNYVKCVNRYLIWCEREDMCFTRAHAKDLTGRRFGRLTALYPTDTRKRKDVLWRCRCDCGNETVVGQTELQNGETKSCGCYKKDPPLKDYIGKRFGRLTVIEYAGKEKNKHRWKCRCDCGKETVVGQTELQSGITKSCGCLVAEQLRKNLQLVEGTSVTILLRNRNRAPIQSNESGYNGVYRVRKTGKWAAQITFKKKTYYLGSYAELEEAVKARKRAEEVYDNFIE